MMERWMPFMFGKNITLLLGLLTLWLRDALFIKQ